MKETEVAAKVVQWFEADGWDVYQEVDGIDIVGVRGRFLVAIECKVSLSWKLCEQAMDRKAFAHFVWIAYPTRRKARGTYSRAPWYAVRCLERDGIGLLEVDMEPRFRMGFEITERVAAAFNRKALVERIRRRLRPEQKKSEAGSPSGGNVWTPFRCTCDELRKLLQGLDHPEEGILVKEAVDRLHHHYATDRSARGSLVEMADRGVIPGIAVKREGHRIFFVQVRGAV